MRISEDRYRREQQSIEVALRFLTHDARSATIEAWTGLTNDRIRNLYASYSKTAGRRRRGRSPYLASMFLRTVRMQKEVSMLASYLSLLEAVPPPGVKYVLTLPNLPLGRLACDAYEMYKAQVPEGRMSIEHALLLDTLLIHGEQLVLSHCVDCDALVVIEPGAVSRCIDCAVSSKRA